MALDTNLIQVDREEVKVLLHSELCLVHAQSNGGGRTRLFVAPSITRNEQSWDSTHSQRLSVEAGIISVVTWQENTKREENNINTPSSGS